MRKISLRLVLWCVALMVFGPSYSAPVSLEQARQHAQSFLSAKSRSVAAHVPVRSRMPAGSSVPAPAYYVFNAAEGGYVVVSGDDATPSVLGYADHGTYDSAHLPEGLRWLLQMYEDQIGRLRTSPVADTPRKVKRGGDQVTPTRHAIQPLMSTLWNQGNPYNRLCPRYYNQDGSQGDLCATGCVATAVAQVMAYYRYPKATLRTIPGYVQRFETSQGDKTVQLRNVPSGSVIDWDNMLDEYSGSESDAQSLAVAQLMYWVGLGCKMGYGPSSAAGFANAVDALVRYFGYDDGTHIESRHRYTAQGWTDLLYNELATGHPVAFAGTNTGGAHAFVLDGYDVDGLFHVNWGWGGMDNGYFRVDVLDPDDTTGIGASPMPGGYNMGQDAIIGMRLPDDVASPSDGYKLTVNDWEIRHGNTFFANYVNWSGVDADWNIGIGRIGDDGTIHLVGSSQTVRINQNFFSSNEFVVRGLGEGTYRIVPISKRTVDQQWQVHVNPFISYVQADVDADGQVSLTIHPVEDVEVTGITFPGNHKRGQTQQVSVSFRNHGEEYYHEVFLFAGRNGNRGEALCRTAVSILAGGESTASFSFTPQESGSWTVWLASDNEGRHLLGQGVVEITEAGIQRTDNLRYVSTLVSNRSNGAIYGNCIQGKVTILNQAAEDFDDRVSLWLFKLADNGYYYGQTKIFAPLHAKSRQTGQATFFFDHLQMDAEYALAVQYEQGEDIPDQGLKPLGRTTKGVVCWLSDNTLKGLQPSALVNTPSTALAVDMSQLGNRVPSVHPNTNPNTLYILSEDAPLPEGLEEANVVRGSHSDDVRLHEGWGFMSPLKFSADVVTYQCQSSKDRWQTISLPFTPDIMPDGLQLLEFSAVDALHTPVFTATSALQRNIPCLYRVERDGPIEFSATDAVISETRNAPMVSGADAFRFWGTTVSKSLGRVLVLNDEGTAFVRHDEEVAVSPFGAYFIAPDEISSIAIPETAEDGIRRPSVVRDEERPVYYNLNGQRVASPRRGIYVTNHRKVVVW